MYFSLVSDTIYNEGQMYDLSTGVATVPVSGTYLFTLTIEHYQTHHIVCYILVDGSNQVRPFGKRLCITTYYHYNLFWCEVLNDKLNALFDYFIQVNFDIICI